MDPHSQASSHQPLTVDSCSQPFDPGTKNVAFWFDPEFRGRCPVAQVTPGMYVVSRYDDVLSVLRNGRDFVSAGAVRAPDAVVPDEEFLFFEIDPPRHAPFRRLIAPLFAPERVRSVASAVRSETELLLQPILRRGAGDLVSDLAAPLTTFSVVVLFLGLPRDDVPELLSWMNEMVESGFLAYNRTDRGEGFAGAFPECAAYIDQQLAMRAGQSDAPDDALTRISMGTVDGRPLTAGEKRMLVVSLISAGNQTTTDFLGNLMLRLTSDSGTFETLRNNRALIAPAIEESLRVDTPLLFALRSCASDVEVGNVVVEQGARVVLNVAGANTDPAAFPDPQTYRLDRREVRPHATFGIGPHACLGAPLARLEAATLLEVLCDRVTQMQLAPGFVPEQTGSVQLNGLRHLDVVLTSTHAVTS